MSRIPKLLKLNGKFGKDENGVNGGAKTGHVAEQMLAT